MIRVADEGAYLLQLDVCKPVLKNRVMTVENWMTHKSVLPLEPGQGQTGSLNLLIDNSNSLHDETPGLPRHGDQLSEVPCVNPASSQGKIELQSKLGSPARPTIVWSRLMLEQ